MVPGFPCVSSIEVCPGSGHRTEAPVKALGPFWTSVGLCACHLNHLFLPVLLSFQVVQIGLWSCTADPADLAVCMEGSLGPALGCDTSSRNGSKSLVKLRSQGPSPPEPSRMPAASVGSTGTLVGDPSGGSLSPPSKERLHLAALVRPHSFRSPLTLGSWKVDAAVATASCCCCWGTPLATWG